VEALRDEVRLADTPLYKNVDDMTKVIDASRNHPLDLAASNFRYLLARGRVTSVPAGTKGVRVLELSNHGLLAKVKRRNGWIGWVSRPSGFLP